MNRKDLAGSVVIAMPAHNEADGIGSFLAEIDQEARKRRETVRVIVLDDASTDETISVLDSLSSSMGIEIQVLRNESNIGHGPSTLRVLSEACNSGASLVVQVDGDGQFCASDILRVLQALKSHPTGVITGIRKERVGPWFRRALTKMVKGYVRLFFGLSHDDPNTPLRAYRREELEVLLRKLPKEPKIPSLYITLLIPKYTSEFFVQVDHRSRRGQRQQGTTWGNREHRFLIPRQLISFVWESFIQSLQFRAEHRSPADQP